MRMLSDSDLQAIGVIMDEKIQANNGWLDKKFDEKLEPVLEAVREGFEAVDRRFEKIENEMARKTDLAAFRHEMMGHTDRTVTGAVGDLRAELRERDLIG